MPKRKPLDNTMEERFVFGDKVTSPTSDDIQENAADTNSKGEKDNNTKSDPWGDIEVPDREPTIRLNVDIPVSLNDRLAEKARKLRKPKTELVRHLLEWVLDESNE